MPKLIVDVNVGQSVVDFLIEDGYEVISIIAMNPKASDTEILETAEREKALLLTMDKDFGELVYKQARKHCGVLLLRLEDQHTATIITVINDILKNHLQELESKFSVYQKGKLRIRK